MRKSNSAMKIKIIHLILPGLILLLMSNCRVFKKGAISAKDDATVKVESDSTEQKKKNALKAYDEVITDKAITKSGLFTVHKVDESWYFEVQDSLLGREILVVNRIAKGPIDNHPEDREEGTLGYGGDFINKTMIRLEKGPDHTLFIRALSYSVNPDSTNAMYEAIQNSSMQPIINALSIKAVGKDSGSYVVEISPIILGDDRLFGFGIAYDKEMNVGKPDKDKTYIKDIKTFPINTEIQVVKTFKLHGVKPEKLGVPKLEPHQAFPMSAEYSTMEINSSMILLPQAAMEPRYYDERVGYFATGYYDYDSDPQRAKPNYMVTRWKLEPREEDMEKYKRGELVEPKKPIVYYIDPATPKMWVPYLIQGVNDWQVAFERAGFKNAIMAREAPAYEEDSTWSLFDARYSAIVWKASPIANASGPHVNDPRSGQILESHVNWYYNIMKLFRTWYVVQASPSDPEARKAELKEELMGKLIRYVASHEVGHALGLRHNMGASFATPVEKLRDKEWVEKNGHTTSIMDYARFNYVAQPEDSIGFEGIFPRINDYDLWAIEWAYRYYPAKTSEEKHSFLNELTTSKVQNPRLRFISGEEGRSDPRAQKEDLGDNAMVASAYGIKNLERIVPKLNQWVNMPGEDYTTLGETYVRVLIQYLMYNLHVIENIGGIYHTPIVEGQPGSSYDIAAESIQKEAVAFLSEYTFQKPEWLYQNEVLDKIWSPEIEITPLLCKFITSQLFEAQRLANLVIAEERYEDVYSVDEYFQDIYQGLWSELKTGGSIDGYRRTLQNFYITNMIKLANPFDTGFEKFMKEITPQPIDVTKTDIPAISKYILRTLKKDVTRAIPKVKDRRTRIHLENVKDTITEFLDKNL